MAWLIKKGGLYVARPGLPSSYTTAPHHAVRYEQRDDAVKNMCPNSERIVYASRHGEMPDPVARNKSGRYRR